MPISWDLLAERSREQRFQLQSLVDGGLAESKALSKVFPKDSNRARKLALWKDYGLFPVSDSEKREFGYSGPDQSKAKTDIPTKEPDTIIFEDIIPKNMVIPKEVFELIGQQVNRAVEKRIATVFTEVAPQGQRPNVGGRGNKGRTYSHINITIPTEINEALIRLGGIKSQHITAALRLYLGMKKPSIDTDDLLDQL